MSTTKYYTLPEIVAILGGDASCRHDKIYDIISYAVKTKRVVKARVIGKAFLFTEPQIDPLRVYLAKKLAAKKHRAAVGSESL
jgi:hypothetical protein